MLAASRARIVQHFPASSALRRSSISLLTEKPRILLLVTLAERGGAQSYVRDLVPSLVERFDVTVAAHGPGPLADEVRAAGAQYVALRHVRRAISPSDAIGLWELYRLCRRLRPHVVHANSSKAGVLGRLAAFLARVPIRVFTVHGWAFKATSGAQATVYLWCDRAMRPLTSAIVCVSETERRAGLAARACRDDRTVVIHNAVDVDAAPVRHHGTAHPVSVVSVGRLAEPKDFVTLLRAFDGAASAATLTILGDGPDRPRVEHEIRELRLANVELAGEVADVPQRLAGADVFVLSSRSEGLPISVLEAMAAGLPVIATDVGGLAELVVPGETGYLVAPGDVAGLAEAIGELVEDASLRERLGRAARRRAEEQFALERWHRAHLELYDRLLAGAPVASAAAGVAR